MLKELEYSYSTPWSHAKLKGGGIARELVGAGLVPKAVELLIWSTSFELFG